MAHLLLEREGHTQTYALGEETTIGRSADSIIRLPTAKASRKHARILRRENAYILEDLGSSNGTLVNGTKITAPHTLHEGDKIQIGGVTFVFFATETDPLVGKTLGKYKIIRKLGSGGMGSVYLAKQMNLDRDVALKVMRSELAKNPEFVKNFQAEAKLAAKLHHHGIIGIHDFGEEKGQYFFSMEYVDGENLFDRLARVGPLSPLEAVTFAKEVAEALSHAHEQKILHQDIKPQNILVTRDDRVKLADLGLAKTMQYGLEKKESGSVMGTPLYLPPEVVRQRPPDPRSDIYSLSATLFHLLTGQPPYRGASPAAIIKQHLEAPVPDPRELVPDLPQELAELVMKGMSKDPARRPPSARAMADALEEIRNHLLLQDAKGGKGKAPMGTSSPKKTPSPGVKKDAGKDDPLQPSASKRPTGEGGKAKGGSPPTREEKIAALLQQGIAFVATIVVMWILSGFAAPPPLAPHEMLRRAEILFDREEYDRARDLLRELLQTWPNAPECAKAKTRLEELGAPNSHTPQYYRRWYSLLADREDGLLRDDQLREQLEALLKEDLPERLRDQAKALLATLKVEKTVQEDPEIAARWARTMQEWKDAKDAIQRRRASGEFGIARSILESFVRRQRGNEIGKEAEAILAELVQIMETTGKERFERAQSLALKKASGEARKEFVAIAKDLPGTEWATRAEEELIRIDREAKTRFFSAWEEIAKGILSLQLTPILPKIESLKSELAGLAWEGPSVDLARLVQATHTYAQTLRHSVEIGLAKEKKDFVSVVGLGLCRLSYEGEKLLADVEGRGKPVEISWDRVAIEDIWRLAPRQDITAEQCLGGALYAVNRKHMGFALSYLKGVSLKEPSNLPLYRQILAQRHGRLAVEAFDFSDVAANLRWIPLEGSLWSFEGEKLSTAETTRAVTRLAGRSFSLADCAVNFVSTQTNPEGQAEVVFLKSEKDFVGAAISGKRVKLKFSSGGKLSTADGELPQPEGTFLFEVKEGKATLYQNRKAVLSLPAPGTPGWDASLQLELNGTPGSFDDILVEEGRS